MDILRLRALHPIAPPAPPLRAILRPLAALFLDSAKVGMALLRALPRRDQAATGALSMQAFRGGGDRPEDAGRRALVTLAVSLAPNGYAVAASGGEQALLMHRLCPAAPETDREWPT